MGVALNSELYSLLCTNFRLELPTRLNQHNKFSNSDWLIVTKLNSTNKEPKKAWNASPCMPLRQLLTPVPNNPNNISSFLSILIKLLSYQKNPSPILCLDPKSFLPLHHSPQPNCGPPS